MIDLHGLVLVDTDIILGIVLAYIGVDIRLYKTEDS